MIELIAVVGGAISRRMIGAPDFNRWMGQLLSGMIVFLLLSPYGWLPATLIGLAIVIAWGLPGHGESIRRPWDMSARWFLITLMLTIIAYGFGISLHYYPLIGATAGLVYAAAYELREPGRDWNALAEYGLGALVLGGLAWSIT